jgi:excinuclease UvrABC nuclease subunit
MILVLKWIGPLRLCVEELGRIPTGVPGVYLLHSFAPALGGYPIFYVGRSCDLRRRMTEYVDDSRAKRSIRLARHLAAAYFSAAALLHPILLESVESGLIRTLRPPCNSNTPAGIPLVVNLPPLWASVPEENEWQRP